MTAWLKLFEMDALRYPVLLLLGASMSGKTEYANSLFRSPLELKVGPLLHFPDGLREFNRKIHDGIILDDVRDLSFFDGEPGQDSRQIQCTAGVWCHAWWPM